MPKTKARKSTKTAARKSPAKPRAKARPKMTDETRKQLARGRKLTIRVRRGASFASMVSEIKRRLVIDPGIIGPRGCLPCHSGIDFSVIGEEVINPG